MMATSHDKQQRAGFTVVELLFAISFLSFVLIFVVTTTVQLIRTYDKCIALKAINQSGRSITDLLSRDISTSKVLTASPSAAQRRLCLDSISYVWNPPSGPINYNKYSTTTTPIELVRVPDSGQKLCIPTNPPTNTVYPTIPVAGAQELLSPNIAVGSLTTASTSVGGARLVQLSMQLTTAGTNAPTLAGNLCDGGIVGEFCASSAFTTTIYVTK